MHPIQTSACGISQSRLMGTRVLKTLVGLFSILIVVSCDTNPTDPLGQISIGTNSLAEAIEGQVYSQQFEASGGNGGYSWLLAAGSLPAGLTLAPSGAISGTPVAPGTSNFRIQATDLSGRTATADRTLSVVQSLAVQTGSLPDGVRGEEYTAQLQAVGGRGTLLWSVTGGDGASWLSISSAGQLSGTPASSGSFTVTVAVSDDSGQQGKRQFPIVVLDPVAVAAMSLPTAVQGRVYAAQLVATGGDGVYAWDIESGALPAGMALGTVGGLLGTAEEAGVFTFTARVTDRAHRVATRALTLTVERAPTIKTSSLQPGRPGEPYTAQLVATGGTGSYSWTVTDGVLPSGLTLSAAGAVSGTPTALGSATFTVQVTDEASVTDTRTLPMVVAAVEALVAGIPTTGIQGDTGSVRYYSMEVPSGASQLTVTISGGTGDVDLYVRRGSLPGLYTYDCRPLRQGNEEICTFTPPFLTAGHWYIMLRGHSAFGGVSLVANHE